MMALKGICKWFDKMKGIGFIVVDGVDYFVHYKEIKVAGYKELKEGQHVTFMAKKGDKGWFATDVIIIKDGDGS